ncbi:filamentous hemagglutinin N-terminal domain-containing protein [Methylomonas sp. 2BW1-5-20]|uniref:two-partner secretion domain-containing protein n=1 Tax=Methylomonas sp. 2BW1-5-20 TaxID=3376686 RepID=UPI00405005AE
MKKPHYPFFGNESLLQLSIRHILTGGVLALYGATDSLADGGLPVSVNAGGANSSAIADLTNAALHPGINVGHASADYSADGQKLTIKQTTDKTILDWQSFDIGAGKSVQFIQPASSSIALNNIHQLDASKIYGNLNANGQVYLVNANGFVFGNGASVNTNSLVATNLKIADEVFAQGISKVVDANASPNNPEPVAALAGDGTVYRNTGNGNREKIRILVESGAQISAGSGGRVIMAAPQVENRGTISAPNGQVILAAATDKVYLQETDDNNLRGLLVEVKTGGDVKNVGKILTERGNTTLMGFAVTQQGLVSASTSVALNGSIHLLAREGARLEAADNRYRLKPLSSTRASAAKDGLGTQASVTLASDSLTTVTLDASAGSAVNGQIQPKSKIDLEAGQIRMQAGAKIVAHSGDVRLIASTTPSNPLDATSATNASRIVLDAGSTIDVSGIKNVELPMSANILDVELRNDELRDAPLQKTGILHGKTVQVDSRTGTSLADISGALGKVQHSINERSVDAGSVELQSEGKVIVDQNATIDISGGSIHYLAGKITTSKLLSNNRVFDIATANPNLTYQQILSNSHYQSDYYQGGDAGNLSIKSRELALSGNIIANTVNSAYQRSADNWASGGTLNIDTAWSNQRQQDIVFINTTGYGIDLNTAAPLYLSSALFAHGVNHLTVRSGGKLTIPQDVTLNLAAAGSLSLQAGKIDVLGNIRTPAGNIELKTLNPTHDLNGRLYLAAGSVIDSSGSWINDLSDSKSGQILKPLTIGGGNIRLQAQGDLVLDGGSKIIANAGAALNNNTKTENGQGGNIDLISAGLEPSALSLSATLSSYALQQGGILSITANGIQLGGTGNTPNALNLSPALLQSGGFSGYRLTANAGDLNIAESTQIRLQQSNWLLKATAINAASGSDLSTLVQLGILPDDLRKAVDLDLNLSHNASIAGGYAADRAIRIGSNAAIVGDPGAEFSLKSDANIDIDGSLIAPAGKIALQLTSPPSALDKGYNPNQAIVLGHHAHLNAAGATVWTTNAQGLALGNVLSGGSIDLTAERGYILTAAGSRMDVSGSQAAIDIVNAKGKSRQTLASAGGTINLAAAEGILLQGQLLGRAGQGSTAAGNGSAAAGGTLSLELNAQHRGEPEDQVFTTTDRVIHFSEELPGLTDAMELAANGIPDTLNGQAYISARQIRQGGFGSLSMAASVIEPDQYAGTPVQPERGEIRFDGSLSLSLAQNLRLDAPLISHSDNGQVVLHSNTFSLGSSWNRNAHGNLGSAIGNGGLSINANLIDLFGSSEIAGFAQTSLNSKGDIRLTGINPNSEADLVGGVSLSGNLSISARQIYPTTLSKYSVKLDAKLNPHGLIDILPGAGDWYTPLSAAGQLNISAPNIVSRGVLLAPFGNIALDAGDSLTLAAGSVTSVSDDDGIVIPFGRTQGGLDWIYPLGIYNNIQNGTPQKAITLSAPDIDLASGAVVNLNGGGDLSAFEFIAGPGGSIDTLDPGAAGYHQNYAVLPSSQADFAAFDPLEFAKSGLNLGDSIYLSANSGLPAGNYVLLPAHYALLPGAYLITPQVGTSDMAAGTTTVRNDGATIVAGYRYSAGTDIADSRWSGFAVESGAIARTRSEYQETTAGKFFTGSSLPQDAGNLSLLAEQNLRMAAQISATSAYGGLGGMLDISADRLAVVSSRSVGVAPGTVLLLAAELNRLGVDSLLLGGRRNRGHVQTQLTVGAQTVTIAAGSHLRVPEILLAASDTISVANDTTLSNTGTLSRTDTRLKVVNTDGSSDGALLRLSAGSQADVVRATDALTGLTGTLDIANGATLSSAGSILLDASKDTRFAGNIAMSQGELTLNSSRISLGNTGGTDGLQLSATTLNGLHVDKLTLNSFSAVDIAGVLNLQLKDLVLNAAGLYGYGSSNQIAAINADNITLKNSGDAPAAFAANGNGQLNLTANTIALGPGEYAWSGFRQVSLRALNAVVNSGTADIRTDSDVTIATPIWTATAGANTSLNLGSHDLTTLAAGNAGNSNALGARLSIAAERINHQGHIELASGIVKLEAAQNLTVSGSIDTSGWDLDLSRQPCLYRRRQYFLEIRGRRSIAERRFAARRIRQSAGRQCRHLIIDSRNGTFKPGWRDTRQGLSRCARRQYQPRRPNRLPG